MTDTRNSLSGLAKTAMIVFGVVATTISGAGLCADDAPVDRAAEEPLEDENVLSAPVDSEPLERDLTPGASDAAAELGAIVEEAVEGLFAGVAAPQVGRQFHPALNRALTIEIHYLRKICNPPPEQVAAIRKAAQAQIPKLAKELNAGQNRGFQGDGQSAREQLIDIVGTAAAKVLPDEQAKRYQEELTAREEYRRSGAAEMMTIQVDDRLSLSNEQYEKVPQALISDWKTRWSRNLQVFMYDDYCPLPEAGILAPILNDDQKKLWGSQGRNSQIWFGWEADLGLDQVGGGVQLKELDDYSAEGTR